MGAFGSVLKLRWIPSFLTFLIITVYCLGEINGKSRPHYSRPRYRETGVSKAIATERQCNGEENLKNDLAVLSFKLSTISSTAGLFALTEFSVPSNDITIISSVLSLILWVPSAVLTFLAWSDPFSWITGNLVNLGSLIVTLYGAFGVVPGTLDIIVSTIDEILGITALILGSLTTFPEQYNELKALLQEVFGREEVNSFLRGYGCGGPNSFGGIVRQMVIGS